MSFYFVSDRLRSVGDVDFIRDLYGFIRYAVYRLGNIFGLVDA